MTENEILSEEKVLTCELLAQFDSILTSLLLDKVFLWFESRKLREPEKVLSGHVYRHKVLKILKEQVIAERNVPAALKEFCHCLHISNYMSKFSDNLKTEFERHARKYLQIHLPDAPFEIVSTNRYGEEFTDQAGVIARTPITEGAEIRYLTGKMVPLRDIVDDEFSKEKDFSLVYSSRADAICLMLGPARFVNHDCYPNSRFVSKGYTMTIVTLKPIEAGEEITVEYSKNYFGDDNCECLCATCERNGSGGYLVDKDNTNHERKSSNGTVKFATSFEEPEDSPANILESPRSMSPLQLEEENTQTKAVSEQRPTRRSARLSTKMRRTWSLVGSRITSILTPPLESHNGDREIKHNHKKRCLSSQEDSSGISKNSSDELEIAAPKKIRLSKRLSERLASQQHINNVIRIWRMTYLKGESVSLICESEGCGGQVYHSHKSLKNYCVRCQRHIKLYELPWPMTRRDQDATKCSLYKDAKASDTPLSLGNGGDRSGNIVRSLRRNSTIDSETYKRLIREESPRSRKHVVTRRSKRTDGTVRYLRSSPITRA